MLNLALKQKFCKYLHVRGAETRLIVLMLAALNLVLHPVPQYSIVSV